LSIIFKRGSRQVWRYWVPLGECLVCHAAVDIPAFLAFPSLIPKWLPGLLPKTVGNCQTWKWSGLCLSSSHFLYWLGGFGFSQYELDPASASHLELPLWGHYSHGSDFCTNTGWWLLIAAKKSLASIWGVKNLAVSAYIMK
jgi:hypothetical protein